MQPLVEDILHLIVDAVASNDEWTSLRTKDTTFWDHKNQKSLVFPVRCYVQPYNRTLAALALASTVTARRARRIMFNRVYLNTPARAATLLDLAVSGPSASLGEYIETLDFFKPRGDGRGRSLDNVEDEVLLWWAWFSSNKGRAFLSRLSNVKTLVLRSWASGQYLSDTPPRVPHELDEARRALLQLPQLRSIDFTSCLFRSWDELVDWTATGDDAKASIRTVNLTSDCTFGRNRLLHDQPSDIDTDGRSRIASLYITERHLVLGSHTDPALMRLCHTLTRLEVDVRFVGIDGGTNREVKASETLQAVAQLVIECAPNLEDLVLRHVGLPLISASGNFDEIESGHVTPWSMLDFLLASSDNVPRRFRLFVGVLPNHREVAFEKCRNQIEGLLGAVYEEDRLVVFQDKL
jgi:hypothetical protein